MPLDPITPVAQSRSGRHVPWHGQVSIRRKLLGVAVVVQLFVISVSVVALLGTHEIVTSNAARSTIGAAKRLHQDTDMMQDALRGDVYRLVLATVLSTPATERRKIVADVRAHADRFRSDLRSIRTLDLDAGTRAILVKIEATLETYVTGG